MDIRLYTSLESIELLYPKNQAVASPFQTFTWQEVWWRHFGQGKELQLLAGFEDEKLQFIIPLYQEDRIWQFLGMPPNISDYLDIVYSNEKMTRDWKQIEQHILNLLHKESLTLKLNHLKVYSPTLTEIINLHPQGIIDSENVPQKVLSGNFEMYLNSLGRKSRHELRRKQRRLQPIPHSFEYFTTPEAVKAQIGTVLELIRQSSSDKERFMDEKMEQFFREMSLEMANQEMMILSLLMIEGRAAASTIGFKLNQTYYLYNSGFDPVQQRLSPGLLLIADNIRYACENNFTLFDFLRGDEPYKFALGGENTMIRNIEFTMTKENV